MDELDRFYKELRAEHEWRVNQEWHKRNERQALGEDIYTTFWVWCQSKWHGKFTTNIRLFDKYCKDNKIELTFWQRKHLAEKYFGYKYEYDHNKQKWKITRAQK